MPALGGRPWAAPGRHPSPHDSGGAIARCGDRLGSMRGIMDPLIIFDCERVIPNRFSLALGAAARMRALSRGAEPRISEVRRASPDTALREISADAFSPNELQILLL